MTPERAEKQGWNLYHMNDTPPTMDVTVRAYQVWSSVLGSSLTKLDPDGEKWETKVFAGGAVIARQDEIGETIKWITADPVTGTEKKNAGRHLADRRREIQCLSYRNKDYAGIFKVSIAIATPERTLES